MVDSSGPAAVEQGPFEATRAPLRESLLHKGSKSVFWTANKLPPPPQTPPEATPLPLFTQQPTHQHPGNSKAMAVFWDLERFDISGDHELCNNAVDAIRSFCQQFVGLAGTRTRDTLMMKGYCAGGKGPQASHDRESGAGVPGNAERQAGIRNSSGNAGLKELATSNLIRSFSAVDKNLFSCENGGAKHEGQMLTDLCVWMLDCTQRRLFVPTAVVILYIYICSAAVL